MFTTSPLMPVIRSELEKKQQPYTPNCDDQQLRRKIVMESLAKIGVPIPKRTLQWCEKHDILSKPYVELGRGIQALYSASQAAEIYACYYLHAADLGLGFRELGELRLLALEYVSQHANSPIEKIPLKFCTRPFWVLWLACKLHALDTPTKAEEAKAVVTRLVNRLRLAIPQTVERYMDNSTPDTLAHVKRLADSYQLLNTMRQRTDWSSVVQMAEENRRYA